MCLAGSMSAGLKNQCSAMKKKCLYSEDTVIPNRMMTLLRGCMRISGGGEGKSFSVYQKEPWVKKEKIEKHSFQIRRLGLYFSLFLTQYGTFVKSLLFHRPVSSCEKSSARLYDSLTLTIKIFFT